MPGADLDKLRQQVRELTDRVGRLEASLAAQANASPVAETASPAFPGDPEILPQISDTTSILPVFGVALLGLAGAYLLRAVAESGVLPPRFVFTLGTLYAVAWLLGAARAPADRRLAAVVYSVTSVLILSPLLWESTLRFNLITTAQASAILVAFTLVGLAVSWQRDLLIVATISILAGVGTAGALLVATHDVMPFTFVLLSIAAAVEACACLNHWLGERWVAAAAANLAVLFATWLVTNPGGLPEAYAPISTHQLLAAQIALLAIYLFSVMVRTLLRGMAFTNFETVQCAVAFVIGLGGALRLSAGGSYVPSAIGAFALLCGVACYTISFIRLDHHGAHGRNFFTYSTYGILLMLVACRILLNDTGVAIMWSLLAVACIGAGGLWNKLTLEIHGGIYLLLALNLSGALHQAGDVLLGADPRPSLASTTLWMGAALAGVSYLLAARSTAGIGDGRNFRALRLAMAGVLVWEVLGISAGSLSAIYHGVSGVAAGDPYCATLRTGVITGAALLLALAGSRPVFRDFAQMIYPLMLLGAFRLVARDLHQGHKAALFLSLFLYGAALIAIPRLRRARAHA